MEVYVGVYVDVGDVGQEIDEEDVGVEVDVWDVGEKANWCNILCHNL